MSLVPAERRALAEIEESLRRSDPGLARMLTRFRLPISRGGWTSLTRGLPRFRSLLAPMIVATAVVLLILAIVLSPGTPLQCIAHRGPGPVAAPVQLSGCHPAGRSGHARGNGQ